MTLRDMALLGLAPVVYLLLIAVGRHLKRRWSVRFGVTYQLFAVVASVSFACSFIAAPIWLLNALGAGVSILGTLVILAIARRAFWERNLGEPRALPAPKFVGQVFSIVIFVAVLLVVLSTFYSLRIPGLLAGSGILAIILGLALQDTLGNILAGLALHFEKPFQVGDWLMLDKIHAQVMEVNWRATRLRTQDEIYHDIPNSQLAKATIVNLSYPTATHAMRLRVGIDYAVAPNAAKAVLLRTVRETEGVLAAPAPAVYFVEFGESAAIYEVKYWLEDHAHFNEITDRLRTHIWYELKRNEMRIPYPTRTVEMVTVSPADGRSRISALLRQQPLFSCFGEAQLDELAGKARQLRFGRGEQIIGQGESGESMFVLVSGAAVVTVGADGRQARVGELKVGDCFGEFSLLTGEPRSASIVAQSDCDVVEIHKSILAPLLQQSPQLINELSSLLARRKLETEGALAQAVHARPGDREKEFTRTFAQRVKAFFEL